jgi:hypothetical protein
MHVHVGVTGVARMAVAHAGLAQGSGGVKPGFVETSPHVGQKTPPPSITAPAAPHAGQVVVGAEDAQDEMSGSSSSPGEWSWSWEWS